MEHLEFGSRQRLAEIYGLNQQEIVSTWLLLAGELFVDLDLDHLAITDHLPDIIAEIIRDLALGRDGSLSTEHTRGSPPVHGVQRFHDGLDVDEVVAEYNLLRVAFVTIAERNGYYLVGEAARLINRRLDEAVRLAVTAFAAQQALIRKTQEDEHLAFIAHDLRTPLNAASLLVELLRAGPGEFAPGEMESMLQSLQRNLGRVAAQVKRVLDLKLTAERDATSFRPERRTFELWPLVERLIVDLRPVAREHGIKLINRIPGTLTVFADAGLLSQVFQNLIDNAFRYAPLGKIVITAREDGAQVLCEVTDDGAGIPPEMLPKVFEKFTTDPEKAGTGLGLAIAQQIIVAHEGAITAESTLGAGATFRFTLPPPPPAH